MSPEVEIEIGFAEDSVTPDCLTIGGRVIRGQLSEGAKGYIEVDSSRLPLIVKDIAFLRGAKPDAIMFTVAKPSIVLDLKKLAGLSFCIG